MDTLSFSDQTQIKLGLLDRASYLAGLVAGKSMRETCNRDGSGDWVFRTAIQCAWLVDDSIIDRMCVAPF